MNDAELLHYSRHILLDGFDVSGQQALGNTSALLVGAGGLGSAVALYLAAAGVGKLTIADGDIVEASNLQRQIIHRHTSIGSNKAHSAVQTVQAINPWITCTALPHTLSDAHLGQHIALHDIIIDASDNFATRHAINRYCVEQRKPLVSGAAIRFDGLISTFDLRQADSPCYHCLFPEQNASEDSRCSENGIFGPLVGIIGAAQAAEAIKLAIGMESTLSGRLVRFDIRHMRWHESRLMRDTECAVCA